MILSIFYLIMFESWKKFILNINYDTIPLKRLMYLSTLPYSRFFVFGLVFLFFTWLIYLIFYAQISRKILKTISIKSKNIESNIEIFSESKDSYFDKYLDDVIYLFDHSKADVIVFEDIDRFDSNIIFSQLKEINTLVNNRKESKQNFSIKLITSLLNKIKYLKLPPIFNRVLSIKRLNFIYLLKDDIFISKERTKFFDFIIPVLPVINSSNSFEKLKKILDENTLFDEFDKKFLQDLSLYVDDMRLLKNIWNEFIIYKVRLKKSTFLNYNNLLAIVAYKNIFPSDFAELQLNKGLVYQIFSNKKEYISNEKKQLESQIADLRSHVENINQNNLKSEKELYALFFNMPTDYYNVTTDDKNVNDFHSNAEFIYSLKTEGGLVNRSGYGGKLKGSFDEIFTSIESNPEFIERRKIIIDKEEIEELKKEIYSLEKERILLSNKKLHIFITRQDIEQIQKSHFSKQQEEENFDIIKNNDYFDFLVFVLVNGYIDEGYEDYLTYFYPNSLKLQDKTFLRSITDERKLEWDYQLSNIPEVYDRLNSQSFSKIESLNYDLFKYLLGCTSLIERSNRLKQIFLMILREDKIDFLISFFIRIDIDLTQILIIEWRKYVPELFLVMFRNQKFTNTEKIAILIKFIDIFNYEDLLEIDSSKKEIVEFIENCPEFLREIKNPSDKFLQNLLDMDIKFKNVAFTKMDHTTSKYLYIHSLYAINLYNISEILNFFYNNDNIRELEHKNYTIIKMQKREPIVEYIEENIEDYLEEYLRFSNGKTEDDIQFIYRLLNNNKISVDIRKRYIETITRNDLLLNDIDDKELWTDAITCNIISLTEYNIIDYFIYSESMWTQNLVDFVNKNESELNFQISNTKDKYMDELKSSFFISTLKEYSLEDIFYKNILYGMNRAYNKGFHIEEVPIEKITILININIIKFNEKSLIDMRTIYPDMVVYFISKNLSSYIKIADNDEIYDFEELNKVLDDNLNKSIAVQREIVDLISEPILVSGKTYNPRLINYILLNKLHPDDIASLCTNYENYSKTTQNIIHDIVKQNINSILEKEYTINKCLLSIILTDLDISLHQKQLLFSRNIQNFVKKDLNNIFNQLDLIEYINLINNKGRYHFKITEVNGNLLSYLRKERLISSFSETDDTYKANANKKSDQI